MVNELLLVNGVSRSYAKGSQLWLAGEKVQRMIYIVNGSAHIFNTRNNGYHQIIDRYNSHDIIAPYTIYIKNYVFNAEATSAIETVEHSLPSFRKLIETEIGKVHWTELLQANLLRTLKRIDMLTYPTVNEKLDEWMKLNNRLPAKGEYTVIANELGISREALYRELGKRRVKWDF